MLLLVVVLVQAYYHLSPVEVTAEAKALDAEAALLAAVTDNGFRAYGILAPEGMDPVAFREITSAPAENWNKVAGTPLWLQGADTPGPEWTYALQFTADAAGSERGDGAIFYGWVNSSGQGALGWQCS